MTIENSEGCAIKLEKKSDIRLEFYGDGGRYSMGFVNKYQYDFWHKQSSVDLWKHLDSEDQPYPKNLTIPSKAVIGCYLHNLNKFGNLVGVESKSLIIKIFINEKLFTEISDVYDVNGDVDLSACELASDEWFPSEPEVADNFNGNKTNFFYIYRTFESGHFFTIEFESDEFDPSLLSWESVDFNGFNIAHSMKYDLPDAQVAERYGEFTGEFEVFAELTSLD
jgi:hypothetical protein